MNPDQLTRLLQELVRIPSVNPVGDPGTSPDQTGERRMVEYLVDFFGKLALDVERREVEPGRENLIAHFASRGGKRSLALAPHTDTVSVAGMTIDPFAAEVHEGRLYGRGACDTKGSLAAMLAALTQAVGQRSFREGDLDVYFCALMGEESGNDGARVLVNQGFRVDFAIAGEPTDLRIVHTHKGALWFRVLTQGRTAHGSMPDAGESAVTKMLPVLEYLLGEYAADLRQQSHPQLGAPTVSVGVVRGGSQTNIVPGACLIEVDRRTLPEEDHSAILTGLQQRFRDVPVAVEIIRDCQPLYTPPTDPFVQHLVAATGQPADRVLQGAPWFSDAALFAGQGMPAAAFGPGSSAQAHTPAEFVPLDQVREAAGILERFLLRSATTD